MSDFSPQKEAGTPPPDEKQPLPTDNSNGKGEGEMKKKREYKDFGHDETEATRMHWLFHRTVFHIHNSVSLRCPC